MSITNPAPDMFTITPAVTAGIKSLVAKWTLLPDADIVAYRVYCDTANPPTTLVAQVASDTNNVPIPGLTTNQTYYVQIEPVYCFGVGTKSQVASGAPIYIQDADLTLTRTIAMSDSDGNPAATLAKLYDDNKTSNGVTYTLSGTDKYVEYRYYVSNILDFINLWTADANGRCYVAYSDDGATWSYLKASSGHALPLVAAASQADAQTNYLQLVSGKNVLAFPVGIVARWMRLYLTGTGYSTTLYEMVPDRLVAAESIICTNLAAINADLGTVTAGTLQSTNWGAGVGSQLLLADGTLKLGGSSSPKLSWDGTTLKMIGQLQIIGPSTNLCNNPGFESGSVWWETGAGIAIVTSGGNGSNYYLQLTRSGGDLYCAQKGMDGKNYWLEANAGDVYEIQADFSGPGSGGVYSAVSLWCADKDKSFIGTIGIGKSNPGGWATVYGTGTLPANTKFIMIVCACTVANGVIGIDNISVRKIPVDLAIGSNTFGAAGIQLQYNSGSPRFYAGDGSNEYIKYSSADGVKIRTSKTDAITIDGGGNISFISLYNNPSILGFSNASGTHRAGLAGRPNAGDTAYYVALDPVDDNFSELYIGEAAGSPYLWGSRWKNIYFNSYNEIFLCSRAAGLVKLHSYYDASASPRGKCEVSSSSSEGKVYLEGFYDSNNYALFTMHATSGAQDFQFDMRYSGTTKTIRMVSTVWGTAALQPATNNEINLGHASYAWKDFYAYVFHDLCLYLDDEDDLALLRAMKPHPTEIQDGHRKLDLTTLPEWATNAKKKGPNDPLFRNLGHFVDLLAGAVRQLDTKITAFETAIKN